MAASSGAERWRAVGVRLSLINGCPGQVGQVMLARLETIIFHVVL